MNSSKNINHFLLETAKLFELIVAIIQKNYKPPSYTYL